MQIIINGEPVNILQSQNLADLIDELGLEGKLAIELNQAIVPRSQFPHTPINSGDKIEIVHAIGGG